MRINKIRLFQDPAARREIASWVLAISLALSFSMATRAYAFEPRRVQQTSMYPTLHDGDIVFLYKLDHIIRRGDIIVFNSPTSSEKLIKRVIGLPGETISFENGNLLINGTRFVENSDRTETDYGQSINSSPVVIPSGTKLGEDEYFVMGDNRDVSYDSRSFGPIKRDSILGKAEAVLWPVDRISTLK